MPEENGWKSWQVDIAADIRELRAKIDSQSDQIAELRAELAGWKGRITGISAVISLIITTISTVLARFWFSK